MDWSSSQWKEGLSSTALQKINALEEKIEKLQKERQQKQTQFECLELLLDKEKRKVEQEKQQTSRLERELQSLSDTCKNLENKQQKLLIEIQNRDSRQNNLEAQLAQAKKQNCRLQQLEKDIEELRCLRENTKLEHKELEEKLKKEQSTIVKQNDAITDLEQTIKSLQEKSLSSSLIVISDKSLTTDANKENIDTFHNVGDDKNSESLRKKILEQENIINNLKEQLKNASSGKEKMGPPSDILTPIKTNTSERSTNNSFSVWDSFGATPSKAGKAIKHHSDSSAFDDSDEKMRNLQLKVKQLSQELECQRHNSEAAKNALEQRLKEKENVLKAEIKQQAQEIQDLDKELREIQNKYQQDVVQTNKKLDIVNAQLQKSELLKQQMEKDLKALELQINSRNTELQQKDEELKDLQKIKNNYEATAKKLNSEKRELEQSYNALQAQKNSWHEEVRDLKMQLEGSNNLVKEKETLLHNMKKENDHLSRVNLEFQTKIQAINKELSASQSEKCHLEKKLQDFDANITSLKENLKVISEEKKNICSLLDLEKTKSAKLEFDLMTNKKDKDSLQSEVENNEKLIDSLKAELEQLKNNSDVKIKMLENKITTSNAEISSLKNKLTEFTQKEMSMQETIKQLKDENDKIANSLEVVSSEKTSMESHIKELMSQLALLQTDNKSKDEMINLLKKEAADMKENYEVKIKILENTVTTSSTEISSLNNKLSESAKNEVFIQGAMKQLKEESQKIADSLKVANSEKASMESHIKELMSQLTLLQADNKSKNEKINQLNKDVADLKENYEVQVAKLKDCVAVSSAEISSLKEKLSEFTKNEMSMQETIQQLNEENNKLTDSLKVLNSEKTSMESHTKELTSQLVLLQTDNKCKDEKINQLKKEDTALKEDYEMKVQELEKSMNSTNVEMLSLKDKLRKFSENELSLQEELEQLQVENNEIKNSLKVVNSEKASMDSHIEELVAQLTALQTDNKLQEDKIILLIKEAADLKENYDKTIDELKKSVNSYSAENSSLQKKLVESTEKNILVQENMSKLEEENKRISSLLNDIDAMESSTQEMKSQLNAVQITLTSKEEELAKLKGEFADLEKKYNDQIKEIEKEKLEVVDSLSNENIKNAELENIVKELNIKISDLQNDLDIKKELINSFNAEMSNCREDYEAKLLELRETLEVLKSENDSISSQAVMYLSNENNLKETLEKIEDEKKIISDSLECETEKCKMLESQVKQLKNNISELEYDIISGVGNELSLKTEVIFLKEDYENKISELQLNNVSLTSKVFTLQEELKEISLREKSLIKRLEETKVECQNVEALASSERVFRKRIEDLLIELNQKNGRINSLESEIASLIENHEMKVQDLEKSLNSVNAKIFALQDKLHESSENELTLREELKKLQLENSETANLFKDINSEKVSMESSIKELVSQLTALQTDNKLKEEKITLLIKEAADLKENYDKEKAKINVNIEDVKMNLLSMLDSMGNISAQSEALQNEICCIKEECQETQLKMTCDQKARLELLCDLLNQLNTIENHVGVLVLNYEGEIALLKTQFCGLEYQIASKSEECSGWFEEKENLLAKIKCIEDKLNLKELELENSILKLHEYVVTIKNVQNDNEVLTIENEKLQEEISHLKDEFHAMDSLIATKNSEYENILDEKTTLYEELKMIEGKLHEKESHLEDLILFKKEQMVVTESLNSVKEKLEQENKQLVNEMSNLKNKLSEMESQRATKCLEYEIISKENVNLHQKIKLLEHRLKGKELELQNNSSVTNEMSTLIEKLEDVKKTLILENTELQDEISCLKNKLIEIESGCEDISNKYILVEEEKKNLMEKVRLMEEEISEKKSNLLNTHKQLVAIENLKNTKENLTHEKTELQAKLSSLSIIMMTAENILQKISSKIADVTLNSQNEFAAVQLLQEQSVKSSKDLHNFTCDYIRDKNAVQTKIKEIEEVCEFVLESLSVFQDHYASCQNLNIPDCIKLEIQNIDSSKIKCEDPRPMCVAYCNGDTVHYSSSTERSVEKFKEELEHKFKDMYNKTSSFEERILAAKERFKFLIHHKLVATDDFGKMHATLKYMKKLHIILHSKKIALESIKSGCQLLQPKNESSEDVFNLISLLSNNCNANNDVNSYFEKCLLVNTYKDLYLTSKMKKVLTSFKSFIDLEISNFEQHFACYKQYDNIEYHYLHKPVVIKMDYLLFLHRLSFDSFHKEKKLINSVVNHGKKIEICAFLDKICAAKVPLIVNCLFKLHERSLSKFDENLVNINLISHIVKKLVLFYAENHPSMSSGTCIHIENFLYLLSKVSIYNITNEKHLILLQNLMYSLLEDLLLMRESFNDEKEQTEDLFDVLINEIDNLKSENTDKQNQIHLLEESLTEERKQKQILDLHANEIVENLNSMVILKKNWERKILEISKLCSVLKNIFDCNNINECDILKLQSEFDALSDNFCLCEECLVAESESQRDVNHIAFTPVNLIHFVAELYMSKTESEKEIMQLKTINTDISQKIIMLKSELENARLEHSTLEQSMCGLKEKLNAKEYELDRLMSKCSCLEDEYQSLNTQFLEINNKYKDLQKAFDDKLSELNKCKQQYEELFSENEQIKDGIMLKEQKIAQCEQTILEHSILKNTLEELREKVDAKEYELENWKTNYSCLENKYQNLNIQFLEKDSEYKDVDKAFNDKLNELDKCKQQYEELFSENQKIKEEIALKEEKIVQYEKTISEHFTLEQCLCELKEKINVKDCELENMKTKYLCLEDEYKSLNAQILETNIKSKELQKAFDDKLNELNECKQQYQELLSENEEIKNELRLKEQKIAQYEQTTSEKMSEYEILLAKSADFEARIHDLNNTINSLNSHVKESNNKLENLEKAKSLLNTTLENVEEELQNTYSEKQKLEENLQEKNSEIERLQQEISSTNNKLTNAENEISNLKITIKELKDTLKGNEKEYDELKNKNCKLQNEICSLTKLIKELKVSIIEKNLSIQKNESIVSELKKNISECDDEKKNLEMKVMILSDELEKKISLMYNLESKLDKTTAEKDDLQKQIADLLSLNYSKAHEDENSYKTKCDQFTSENSSLRLEIENLTQEKINLENNIKEYCDKICALEEELKKADQMQENLSHERDDLKKNLHILKRDMQIKNKSHVENSLFMQELAQKVDKLRNELSESGQIAAKKIKELSQENSSLHAEICLLKSQSNVDYKNNTNSVIDTSNFKSSNNLKEFLKKFVGVLIEAIKKTECNNDIGKYKSECLSQLGKWEDNITDSDSYINDIYKKLHSFLQYYVSMQKDLESKLDNLTKAVFKHVTELNKYCEESEDCVNCFNVTALGEISYLNETMYGDSTTSINCDINKLTHELQNSCQKLNTRFNSLRTTILNREMEVKSLQDDLSQMQQLKENPPNGEQNTDGKVQNLEIKCKMLLSNARRLEKKHNNLLKTCEEMENHIKTLEKEKQELENEAEEMATMLRDQTSSDEVLEISIRLAEKNKQLEHLKEENSCLKSHLKRYESFVKENSLSVSKIAEQSQSDSS